MSNSITQYTGTFTKLDGTPRTMNFIKVSDLPSSRFSESQRKESTGEIKTVYDTDVHGFRSFNHGRTVGVIKSTNVNYSFDKS